MANIPINQEQIDRLKGMAKEIANQVQQFIVKHSSVSVERTILRLYGVEGVDEEGTPLPNRIVEILREKRGLESCVSKPFAAVTLAVFQMLGTDWLQTRPQAGRIAETCST